MISWMVTSFHLYIPIFLKACLNLLWNVKFISILSKTKFWIHLNFISVFQTQNNYKNRATLWKNKLSLLVRLFLKKYRFLYWFLIIITNQPRNSIKRNITTNFRRGIHLFFVLNHLDITKERFHISYIKKEIKYFISYIKSEMNTDLLKCSWILISISSNNFSLHHNEK